MAVISVFPRPSALKISLVWHRLYFAVFFFNAKGRGKTLIKSDDGVVIMNDYLHSEITEQIIKAAYKGYNTLGYGFVEKVYENALRVELKKWGLGV